MMTISHQLNHTAEYKELSKNDWHLNFHRAGYTSNLNSSLQHPLHHKVTKFEKYFLGSWQNTYLNNNERGTDMFHLVTKCYLIWITTFQLSWKKDITFFSTFQDDQKLVLIERKPFLKIVVLCNLLWSMT